MKYLESTMTLRVQNILHVKFLSIEHYSFFTSSPKRYLQTVNKFPIKGNQLV